jgi:shikimate kinase
VVDAARQIHNVALIGFMGTGKSTVGHLVASTLCFQFIDTDDLIEKRAGRKIAEIFAQDGEESFRKLEGDVVKELENVRHAVIATGGGLVVNPANLASLRKHAVLICLWASAEAIWARVRHQGHRPLLHDPDPLGKVRALLKEREPFYRQADVLLNSEFRSAKQVAHHAVHQFRAASKLSPDGPG